MALKRYLWYTDLILITMFMSHLNSRPSNTHVPMSILPQLLYFS